MAKATTTTKKPATTKEVAVKAAAMSPAVQSGISPDAFNPAAWGKQELTAKDIVIPKIFAMQGLSKPVTNGEAKMGEFRDSNGILLGGLDKPIEFIPFYRTVEWVIFRKNGDVFKFQRIEAITPQNENNQMEITDDDGNEEKWYRTTNYFCLLPHEMEDGGALPYLLSFRSTSARAGSQIATTMYIKNIKPRALPPERQHEATPASTVMKLVGEKVTNDKGTFIVMKAQEVRLSTPQQVAEAFAWVQTIQKGAVKVDHSDLENEVNRGRSEPVIEPDPATADQF